LTENYFYNFFQHTKTNKLCLEICFCCPSQKNILIATILQNLFSILVVIKSLIGSLNHILLANRTFYKQRIICKPSNFYWCTSQLGPGTAQEKFNELRSTIWTFFVKQSLFSSDLSRFWSLGYPGVCGLGWRGHSCAQNFPRVGGEVCTKFGGDWSGGSPVKRGHRYITVQTVSFTCIDSHTTTERIFTTTFLYVHTHEG